MAENEIVKACCELLTMKNIFHYRNNSGAMKTETGHFYRFGAPGSPDIIAVINGQYVGIECKTNKGRQSESQKEFEGRLKKAGGQYWLVRSVEELLLKL